MGESLTATPWLSNIGVGGKELMKAEGFLHKCSWNNNHGLMKNNTGFVPGNLMTAKNAHCG